MKLKLAVFAATGLVGFHLFMTAIYLGPSNVLKLRMATFVGQYMNPLFSQNWHLFSPNPGISTLSLAARCQSPEGMWSEWKEPFAGLVRHHHATRISGYGKVLMQFDDIAAQLKEQKIRELTAETPSPLPLLQESPKDLATRFARDYCQSLTPAVVAAVQYKVLEFFPQDFTEYKEDASPWSRVSEYAYGPVRLKGAS